MWTTANLENSLADHRHLAMPPITMEIRTPAEALEAEANPDIQWLRELREMRGRVIYNEWGRNPVFLSANGTPSDPDPYDLQAHHVLLRLSQRVVACARISPLDCSKPGLISTLLGQKRFDRILRDLGTPPELSCEGSRWVVGKDFRSLGLGPRVVATSWALVRSLGRHIGFVLAGTRYGQDKLLCRLGAQPVHGVPTLSACVVNDEVRLLHFNGDPPKMIRKKFEQAMLMLGLSTVPRES
jgi:hypothetical protein